jgi:hypothetical protein
MKIRRCARCARPLARHVRADARFCSTTCRTARWHRCARTARALERKRRCAVCRKSISISARADTRYCSPACRQHGYRRRQAAAAAAKPRKAHQRLIRERLAAADAPRAVDIGKAEVRAISYADAKAIITRYEWLGTMPVSQFHFGIFFDGELGGVAVYGAEPSENLGVWDRYGYSGRIIALLRGACLHWAHPRSARLRAHSRQWQDDVRAAGGAASRHARRSRPDQARLRCRDGHATRQVLCLPRHSHRA